MATLNATVVAKVRKADISDPFALVPAGLYRLKLTKVESGKSQTSNKAMWTWHFDAVEPQARRGFREYTITEDDSSLWKLAILFNAFGVDPSTSTDKLLGKTLIAELGTEIQTAGKGKGKLRNYVVGYPEDQTQEPVIFEVDEAPEATVPAKAAKSKGKPVTDDVPDF